MSNLCTTYDFTTCKTCGAKGVPTYRIRCGTLYVCSSCALHYLDYLDEYHEVDPQIDFSALTDDLVQYIETQLQASEKRFANHIRLLEEYGSLRGKRILDIGCGGGLFLTKARDLGAEVRGVELHDGRAAYCVSKHKLDVVKYPIEHAYWEPHFGTFDFVTLWDVLEHVNFPLQTIQAAAKLLKPNGVLILDTPCRNSFYHRAGILTYRLSLGFFPTFLNTMYSANPYGHKQILSTREMEKLFERARLQTIKLKTFHELTFPYEFYLRRLLRSDRLAQWTAPLAAMFFQVFRIKNKMVAAGRKVDTSSRMDLFRRSQEAS